MGLSWIQILIVIVLLVLLFGTGADFIIDG